LSVGVSSMPYDWQKNSPKRPKKKQQNTSTNLHGIPSFQKVGAWKAKWFLTLFLHLTVQYLLAPFSRTKNTR
jgi:hypothetical protein